MLVATPERERIAGVTNFLQPGTAICDQDSFRKAIELKRLEANQHIVPHNSIRSAGTTRPALSSGWCQHLPKAIFGAGHEGIDAFRQADLTGHTCWRSATRTRFQDLTNRKIAIRGLLSGAERSDACHGWERWCLFGNRKESLFSGKKAVDSIRNLKFSGFLRARSVVSPKQSVRSETPN
jgi:hypothetical protein